MMIKAEEIAKCLTIATGSNVEGRRMVARGLEVVPALTEGHGAITAFVRVSGIFFKRYVLERIEVPYWKDDNELSNVYRRYEVNVPMKYNRKSGYLTVLKNN